MTTPNPNDPKNIDPKNRDLDPEKLTDETTARLSLIHI